MLALSESRLIAAIENHPDQINQPSVLHLRPLHLSVEWPYGIKALLQYGADVDVTDQMGCDPVAHAIGRMCSKSLHLFEKAGCLSLIGEKLQFAMKLERRASPYNLSARVGIVDSIIQMEANRRRKLQSLLADRLPEGVYFTLLFGPDRLLNEQAPNARAALRRHNFSLPADLRPAYDYGTVYHYKYLTIRILNTFWEAGFRDVNGLDATGHTPLMAMNFKNSDVEEAVEVLNWFENKGAAIHEKIHHLHQNSRIHIEPEVRNLYMNSGHTVLHYVYLNLFDYFLWDTFALAINHVPWFGSESSNGLSVDLRRIINIENQDACICACSSGGCQALHMMLKSAFQNYRQYHSKISAFRNRLLSLFHPNDMTSNGLRSETVRLLTFERLRLTHTCCRKRECDSNYHRFFLVSLDQEERDEIQEEEKKDLELLENLLVEFDQQWAQTEDPFKAHFMKGYWHTRMMEVMSERQPMDFEKIRDMGVVLHDSDADADIGTYTDIEKIEDENEDEDKDKYEDADEDVVRSNDSP